MGRHATDDDRRTAARCHEVGPGDNELGTVGDFAIDVKNSGLSDAWNATLRDLVPDGATGGMCDQTA